MDDNIIADTNPSSFTVIYRKSTVTCIEMSE